MPQIKSSDSWGALDTTVDFSIPQKYSVSIGSL